MAGPDQMDGPDRSGGSVHDGDPQARHPLTNDLIGTVLAARGYRFDTDGDGDLFGSWNNNLIYFFRLGPAAELLQVRVLTGTTFTIEDVPGLYGFCNSWNHDRLWPKAFVHVDDDGAARVCGEVIADLTCGVTTHQLDQLLACGISTGCQLADAVAELRS